MVFLGFDGSILEVSIIDGGKLHSHLVCQDGKDGRVLWYAHLDLESIEVFLGIGTRAVERPPEPREYIVEEDPEEPGSSV